MSSMLLHNSDTGFRYRFLKKDALVLFKAQLGEPFLGILIFYFASFFLRLLHLCFCFSHLFALLFPKTGTEAPKTGT